MNDERGAGGHRGEHAGRTHLRHLLVGEDADDEDLGVPGDVVKSRDGLRAERRHRSTLLARPTQHADVIAGFDETRDHRAAHAARPDESDSCHRGCSMDSSAVSAAVNTEPSGADALAAIVDA